MMALGFAGSAFADAINSFTWDTYSSDDKMYVCNVGIKHRDGRQGHVDPNAGGANSGDTLTTHDYMTVEYATLDNDLTRGPIQEKTLEASIGAYTQLFTDGDAHGKVVTKLEVNLSSENYGAEYFVDICYRGAQIDYNAANINTSYVLKRNQLTYADHTNASDAGRHYFSEAKLSVASKTVCDTQLTGTSTGAGFGLDFVLGEANVAAYLGNSRFASSTVFLGNANQTVNFVLAANPSLNGPAGAKDAPKYCKTRYTVKENRLKQAATQGTPSQCTGYYGYRTQYWVPRTCTGWWSTSCSGGYYAYNYYTYYASLNGLASSAACLSYIRSRSNYNYVQSYNFTPAVPGLPEIKEPRNWTRMGGQFSALTEIENHGLQ